MTISQYPVFIFFLMAPLLLNACQSKSAQVDLQTLEPFKTSEPVYRTETATVIARPTGTAIPTATSPATGTPTPTTAICSPLAGYSRSELEAAVFNPFNPPAAGLDGPHQGVDFADLEPVNRFAQSGLAVQAVLAGKVAARIDDRFPYGNALMIETGLAELPPEWLDSLQLPPAQPPQTPHPALTCPDAPLPDWNASTRSLYLLYAHLQQASELKPGDPVGCGQIVGAVGSSGNALNPHLHLEIRVGPGGARFESLAHYDSSASPEEMASYCTWRVRGIFKLVDPMLLIHQIPEQPSG